MRLPLENPATQAAEAPHLRRRSIFGKLFHGTGWLVATPVIWSGAHRIKRGWLLIENLFGLLRAGPARDNRFKTADKTAFDLQATAFSYGISVQQLEARLTARRKQTARLAYAAFTIGWVFLVGWIWQALVSPLTVTRIISALTFLPFCAVFFLVALYNALVNYQIRIGRLASWREYLATADRFWPN